ncbi:BtpA/SgcQ family protein [Nonomuraea sp. M3C6]|uniref:BtpA/SgcQ family protein n=1 Tax=Nonomuraea marmarensis TaxID=3351344 RepID=A0ABW7AI19_9ACTN
MPSTPHPTDRFTRLFDGRKPLIGNIHLDPLPGAPGYRGEDVEAIYAKGVRDALSLVDGGIDAIVVENAGDLPYVRPEKIGPETVAALTAATLRVVEAVPVPVGITCVANGVIPGVAVAKATGASFVRANIWVTSYVANEGLLDGVAAEAVRYAHTIGAADLVFLADVKVKFGAHALTADRGIEELARDAQMYCADAVIVSGLRTGHATSVEDVLAVKGATDLPVLVGSGLTADNGRPLLEAADGAIVGAGLKHDGLWWNPVDPARTRELVKAVR